MVKSLKECVNEKQCVVAVEVKVYFVSFYNNLLGMCPYLVVGVISHTINNINGWGLIILEAYDPAAKNVTNTVVLNKSTDGVSCEKKCDMTQSFEYPDGNTDQLYLPNTNINIKIWGISSVADPLLLTCGIKMMTNKRNLVMDTAAVIFSFPGDICCSQGVVHIMKTSTPGFVEGRSSKNSLSNN